MNHRGTKLDASHRGYALLVTLVMLALLGVILGGLARRSADAALQAREAEQQMRQRWAERSCVDALLLNAAGRAHQRLNHWQASQYDGERHSAAAVLPQRLELFTLTLAGLEVWGRIDDEQAKVNLNERLRASPDAAIMPSAVVDKALSPSRSIGLRLTRKPFVESLGLSPLMAWPQVFADHTPQDLLGVERADDLVVPRTPSAIVDRITLWGDGALNIRMADDQAVRERLRDAVEPNTIETLLRLRAEELSLSLGTLIENATEDRKDRAVLTKALVEESACYGMWLAIRPAGQHNALATWTFYVAEQDGDRQPIRLRAFRW